MGSRRERRKQEQALADLVARSVWEGERRATQRLLTRAVRYVLGQEVLEIVAEINQSGPTAALTALRRLAGTVWPRRWRSTLEPILGDVMQGATEPAAPVLGGFEGNPRMNAYLAGYTSELADTLSNTSYENFERILTGAQGEGLSVPEMSKRLEERLPEVNRTRGDLIARTELNRAGNGAALKQAQESGVVRGKRWSTAGDGRVRDEHRELDGVVVGVDEPFPNGLMAPGEPGCRCGLRFELDYDAIRGRTA